MTREFRNFEFPMHKYQAKYLNNLNAKKLSRDDIYKRARDHPKIDKQKFESIKNFIKQNEVDTDFVMYDIEDENESNIKDHFKSHIFETIFQPPTSSGPIPKKDNNDSDENDSLKYDKKFSIK